MKRLILASVFLYAAASMDVNAEINKAAAQWLKSNEDVQSMIDTVQRLAPWKMSDAIHIVDARITGDLFVIHYEMQMTESQVGDSLLANEIPLQQFKDEGKNRTMADVCSMDFTMDVLNHGGRVAGAFSYKNGPIAYMAEASTPADCE
jgi:hypothetical protein